MFGRFSPSKREKKLLFHFILFLSFSLYKSFNLSTSFSLINFVIYVIILYFKGLLNIKKQSYIHDIKLLLFFIYYKMDFKPNSNTPHKENEGSCVGQHIMGGPITTR